MKKISEEDQKRLEAYANGEREPPSEMAAYFVGKIKEAQQGRALAMQKTKQLAAQLKAAEDLAISHNAQFAGYSRDLLEWLNRADAEAKPGEGNGRDGPVFTPEERREMLGKDKPEAEVAP